MGLGVLGGLTWCDCCLFWMVLMTGWLIVLVWLRF